MNRFPWVKQLLRKAGTIYRILSGRDASSVRDFIARHYLHGDGLEVGALDKPMSVPQGVKVRYVDRMTREDLLKHYPELTGNKLVSVNIVADGETLAGIEDGSRDFVIANHFLEHCEDPIATLKNFLRVTRPGGVLFITLPDKRYTFDRDRPETTYEHLLRDHQEGPEGSRKEHFSEWVKCVEKKTGDEANRESSRLLAAGYSIHYHVFTGSGMLEILERLRHEQGLEFRTEAFLQNEEEFVCILRRYLFRPAAKNDNPFLQPVRPKV